MSFKTIIGKIAEPSKLSLKCNKTFCYKKISDIKHFTTESYFIVDIEQINRLSGTGKSITELKKLLSFIRGNQLRPNTFYK